MAETFTLEDESGVSLSDVSKLDTMVTVVDAVNFLKDYDEAKYLQDVGESLGEEDERSVADLLVDQVEFADVILISKTDLVKNKINYHNSISEKSVMISAANGFGISELKNVIIKNLSKYNLIKFLHQQPYQV